jgi:hypothetical protein
MKKELQEIHTFVNNVFDPSAESIAVYKGKIEEAIRLIEKIPFSNNVLLENWKTLAVDEFHKELNDRFSEKFNRLLSAERKAELKFSKITVANILMNIIMNL